MIDTGDITGVILAGGKSRRMGADKALLRFRGQTFVERLFEVLASVFESTVISASGPEKYSFLRLPTVTDIFPDAGPLAGIHAALNASETHHIFVVPCDMPLVTSEIVVDITGAAKAGEITVASDGERLVSLLGVYPCGILSDLSKFLETGENRVMEFLKMNELLCSAVDLSGSAELLRNITTPSDYRVLREDEP